MPVVFWFSRLQPGVTAEAYEQWVREVDYQLAKKLPSLVNYTVYRAEGPCLGEEAIPYDYVEIAEITDLDDYRRDISDHPAAVKIVKEIGYYVESTGNVWGNRIEEA
jgi:hypothetical protein